MLQVDLHAHTRFFHGFPRLGRAYDPVGARMLAWTARRRGLDAIATTNHDYYRELDVGSDDLTIVPGIEVTTTRGHALVVGPSPPKRTEPGELTPEQVVAIAHDRDCAAIIPHPFRNSTVREADAEFDAVEINGKGTESTETVRRFAGERDLPLVGGSDAHYPIKVGRAVTRVDAANDTPRAIADAISDGRVSAAVVDTPSQRLIRRGYRLTHGYKGYLDPSDVEPPGLGTPPGEPTSEDGERSIDPGGGASE